MEGVPACSRAGSSPKLSDKKAPFIDPVKLIVDVKKVLHGAVIAGVGIQPAVAYAHIFRHAAKSGFLQGQTDFL